MTDPVLVSSQHGFATLVLNRPERLNALDADMAATLHAKLDRLQADKTIRCVEVCGAGPAFMAGGDLAWFRRVLESPETGKATRLDPVFDHVHGIITTLRHMPQPVLARVHGAVAGFGMSLMMACDLAVAGESTQFTLAYCDIGTSPDGGSTFMLPRIVGIKRAMELALLSERFDSGRALELGLVNRVTPDAELEEQCQKLITRLTSGPSKAFANTKRLINEAFDNDLETQLDKERSCFLECFGSADFKTGITAFLDKKKPRFGGG